MTEQRKHALLSASGSSYWLNCGPSALASERAEDVDNEYNTEGTLAHELVELKLLKYLRLVPTPVKDALALKRIKANPLYSDEMDRVTSEHVDMVTDEMNRYYKAAAHIELKVDFREYAPDGFGTCDTVIYDDDELTIIDYKHGAGVIVSALGNSQTRLYALGALSTLGITDKVQTVRMIISQPRRGNWSEEVLEISTLLKWGRDYVRPRALLAYVGDGKRTPGKWCQFCDALPRCKAVRDMVHTMSDGTYENKDDLSPDELKAVYDKTDLIRSWLVSVGTRIEHELTEGRTVPGLKIVRTKGRRYWTNPEEVARILMDDLGVDVDIITNTKLRGIEYIKGLIPEDDFLMYLDELIDVSPGKPTITHENDPRPAIGAESAAEDFKEPIDFTY